MRTAEQALREHGLTGEQLLSLSRRAATDALKRHGAFLDEHRFQELADYMLEVGVRYAARYETGHGIAIQTFLYRRMRIRYTDWLRLTFGDTRAGRPSRVPPRNLFPLDELDGRAWDGGYGEVDERLSAASDVPTCAPS